MSTIDPAIMISAVWACTMLIFCALISSYRRYNFIMDTIQAAVRFTNDVFTRDSMLWRDVRTRKDMRKARKIIAAQFVYFNALPSMEKREEFMKAEGIESYAGYLATREHLNRMFEERGLSYQEFTENCRQDFYTYANSINQILHEAKQPQKKQKFSLSRSI